MYKNAIGRTLPILAFVAVFALVANADDIEEAESLERAGDRQGAIALLENAKKAGKHEADLHLGRMAFKNYDFTGAQRHYAAFAKLQKKASAEARELYRESERQLHDAQGFIERVEQITIIDSIAVDADDFFKAYRLPESSGALLPADSIPFANRRGSASMAFANENRDFMMWCEADSTGKTRLTESIRLIDGEWSTPVLAPETLNGGGDADYPFMMADGTTLYYAADGEESIGGLDIFIVTRDASTGEYLQPQNLGMPYNSPYDDYMLAMDELNGIGWWATDRNCLGDKVTIYVFMTNDMRKNYDIDELEEDELLGYAKISNWRATWHEEDMPRINEAISNVKEINPRRKPKAVDFHFPVGQGKEYTTLSDFPDQTSRSMMQQYLSLRKNYQDMREQLDTLRKEYHRRPTKAKGSEIERVEKECDILVQKVNKARSEVYRALTR